MSTHEIRQGADEEVEIPDVRDASGVPISPGNVTSVRCQLRSLLDPFTTPPNPLLELSSLADPATVVVTTGTVTLKFGAAATAAATWRTARFTVELTDTAGKKAWVDNGIIKLLPEYTL